MVLQNRPERLSCDGGSAAGIWSSAPHLLFAGNNRQLFLFPDSRDGYKNAVHVRSILLLRAGSIQGQQ